MLLSEHGDEGRSWVHHRVWWAVERLETSKTTPNEEVQVSWSTDGNALLPCGTSDGTTKLLVVGWALLLASLFRARMNALAVQG